MLTSSFDPTDVRSLFRIHKHQFMKLAEDIQNRFPKEKAVSVCYLEGPIKTLGLKF